MASCLFFPSPTLQSMDPPENKFLGVYHVSLLKILGMEFLPDWHPHLCINYANSIHQSRSKQHCQTVDFTEATDTGIAFSSVLMQINSPITDISAIHARFRSHHVKVVGKPAYIVQTIRWIKCAVAAKSRHCLALRTITHNPPAPVRAFKQNAAMVIFPLNVVKRSSLARKNWSNDRVDPVQKSTKRIQSAKKM